MGAGDKSNMIPWISIKPPRYVYSNIRRRGFQIAEVGKAACKGSLESAVRTERQPCVPLKSSVRSSTKTQIPTNAE
jgi:hypothetical protein